MQLAKCFIGQVRWSIYTWRLNSLGTLIHFSPFRRLTSLNSLITILNCRSLISMEQCSLLFAKRTAWKMSVDALHFCVIFAQVNLLDFTLIDIYSFFAGRIRICDSMSGGRGGHSKITFKCWTENEHSWVTVEVWEKFEDNGNTNSSNEEQPQQFRWFLWRYLPV